VTEGQTSHDRGVQRVRLGAELRRLRLLAGLSGREVAHHLGVGQASVSRIENGQTVPPMPQVGLWADAVTASPEQRETMMALAEAALNEIASWRTRQRAGFSTLQADVRADEATARVHYCFQPSLIPGLLQTAEYARRVFALVDVIGDGDYAGGVAGRLERQKILYKGEHRFEFIVTEAALRLRIGSQQVMDVQLAHIETVATLSNVDVWVIPVDVDARAIPWCGFNLYDERGELDPFVTIELPHVGITVSDSADVALYRQQLDLLRESAVSFADYMAGVRSGVSTPKEGGSD
jgi:transcriptional regulator with XRE-family HTH domain